MAMVGVLHEGTDRRTAVETAPVSRSLLPPRVDLELRSLERSREPDRDQISALRETIEAIWTIVEAVAYEGSLDVLARRELVQHRTSALSVVVRRGVASGALRPRCPSWTVWCLPFAIVTGACVHWMLGLATGPSFRASTAVEGALGVPRSGGLTGRAPVHNPRVDGRS